MSTPNANSVWAVRWLLMCKLGVALALMTFLITRIGLSSLAGVLVTVDPVMGVSVVGCVLAWTLLGAFNVWILLRAIHPIRFVPFLTAYAYGWAIGLITPGQLGDASLILLLKRYRVPLRRASLAYIMDKMITVAVLAGVTWYGCHVVVPGVEVIWQGVMMVGCVAVLIALLAVKFLIPRIRWLKTVAGRVNGVLAEMHAFRGQWGAVLANLLMTVVKWLGLGLIYHIAFRAYGAPIRWPDIGVIPVMSTLVGYLPLSIAGIGTVELTATYLFSQIGVATSVVLSVYMFLRALQYLLAMGTILCLGRIKQPID